MSFRAQELARRMARSLDLSGSTTRLPTRPTACQTLPPGGNAARGKSGSQVLFARETKIKKAGFAADVRPSCPFARRFTRRAFLPPGPYEPLASDLLALERGNVGLLERRGNLPESARERRPPDGARKAIRSQVDRPRGRRARESAHAAPSRIGPRGLAAQVARPSGPSGFAKSR